MTIVARGFGWRHAGRRRWAVREIDLTIAAGERVLLLGASGSGKSTLLRAFAGVLGDADEGESAGELLVEGGHPTQRRGVTALVQQDPQSQVVLGRVGDDVAFGAENLAVPRSDIWPRVIAALAKVGLNVPLDHSTAALSGGQLQRLALAGALAMQSRVLLLDEPTANLDPVGVVEVREAVAEMVADRTTTLVVVEHRVDVWADLVDRVIVVSADGGVLADGAPDRVLTEQRETLVAAGVWVPDVPVEVTPPAAPTATEPLLTTHSLVVGRDQPVRMIDDLAITPGSLVIAGPNGVGKSTLALTCAGLLPPHAGQVVASDRLRQRCDRQPIRWTSRDLAGRIGMVFQQPEHMFVAATVADEVRLSVGPDLALADELLASLHLDHLAGAHPFSLSGGEQRRLSVGVVLGARPRVVVVDEPTFGQDRNTWHDLVRLFTGLVDQGHAVVSVTHDPAFIEVMGQRRLLLEPKAMP